MKVTLISLKETLAAQKANRPALVPELLAACAARYSRSNDGLTAILSKVDPANQEKSINSIFKLIDYGHQSVADIVPVALFIDDISIWLAYLCWSLCPTRIDLPVYGDNIDPGEDELLGGQESSTRYIKMSVDGLPEPSELGIAEADALGWKLAMGKLFEAYEVATAFWQKHAQEHPEKMGIPKSLLADTSEKAVKQVDRMRRNYAFDRARYFLPVAARTNMAMVMPARTWAALCQYLLSSNQVEMVNLGNAIRQELELASPNLVRHSVAKDYTTAAIAQEFAEYVTEANDDWSWNGVGRLSQALPRTIDITNPTSECSPEMDILPARRWLKSEWFDEQLAKDLKNHANRYAPFGRTLRNTVVRFGWSAVALAEIRDLNRHRTGSKDCPPVPLGFYCAFDQADEALLALIDHRKFGSEMCLEGLKRLQTGQQGYEYFLPLGVQFAFSHVTTADKFIYEAELRTGTGAHYRYASHLRSVLQLWYNNFPSTKNLIHEGTAEPE